MIRIGLAHAQKHMKFKTEKRRMGGVDDLDYIRTINNVKEFFPITKMAR